MKVGLVGAGFIGEAHLDAYAKIPEAEVVGVADARPQTASAAAAAAGCKPDLAKQAAHSRTLQTLPGF